MVRRCCVDDCTESDLTILCHRFSKIEMIASRWREALQIQNRTIKDLQSSWAVCTRHFKPSDYRNAASNCLNTTAVPNLGDNSDNERIRTTDKRIIANAVVEKGFRCHIPIEQPPKAPTRKITVYPQAGTIGSFTGPPIIIKKSKLEEPLITIQSNQLVNPKEEYESTEVDMDQAEEEYEVHQDASTMTESISTKDQQIQVELSEPQAPSKSSASDKDDKIIALLYPEYASKSKIDLIKILKEKDLKIASLEEKEKQLENALKSVL